MKTLLITFLLASFLTGANSADELTDARAISDSPINIHETGLVWLERAREAIKATPTNRYKVQGNSHIITNHFDERNIFATFIVTKGLVNSLKISDTRNGIVEGYQYSSNGTISQYWKCETNLNTSEALQFDHAGNLQTELFLRNGKVVTNSLGKAISRAEWNALLKREKQSR